jgi:hypothetical protein
MKKIAIVTIYKTLIFEDDMFILITKCSNRESKKTLSQIEAYYFLKETGQLCQSHIQLYFKDMQL